MAPSDARFMDPEDWRSLEVCLETIIPTYERVNRAMSLGQVGRWRKRIQRHVKPGELVVELGSGPGQFAAGIPHARRILVDPLPAMHRAARVLLGNGTVGSRSAADDGVRGDVSFAVGTGEAVPLEDGIADHVVCAFSFRDFLDKEAGLREMLRLLRPGGRMWILDVRRAERQPMAALVRFHVHRVVPVLGRLLTPRRVQREWRGDPYVAFARTYDAFGAPGFYADLARNVGFVDVEAQALTLGGAMLLHGRRPTSSAGVDAPERV